MIKGTRPKGRLRTKYISQIIKGAGVTSYKELKDMVYDSKKWGKAIIVITFKKPIFKLIKKNMQN